MSAIADDGSDVSSSAYEAGSAAPLPSGYRGFLKALIGERPLLFVWVIAVQTLASLGQAISVLLLIPLLGAVGVHASGGLTSSIRHAFTAVGLRPTLTAVLAVYVAVIAVSAALTAYQTVLTTRYRLEFVDHLRRRLYSALARAQWRQLMQLRQSDLLAVLTTNITWVGIGALGTLSVVVNALVVGAELAAAIRISPELTGLALASGVCLVAVVWPLIRRSRRLGAILAARNRDVLGQATGFLDALKLVKAYGREDEHVAAFERSLTGARELQVDFAWASGLANAVQLTLTAALLAVTVDVAVRYLHVSVGALLVVAFVFTRVVSQVAGSQTGIQQLAQAVPAFDEVMALISGVEKADERRVGTGRRAPRVRLGNGVKLEQVRFSYPQSDHSRIEALRGVTIAIPVGSMVAIAGPSGAGKTTLADIVTGLITPTDGEVKVGGRSLTGELLRGWRSSVALVPQDPFLFHDSIRANLTWAQPHASDAEIWDALSTAAAADFVSQLPEGIEQVVGDRGTRLSGGERQRLALARALIRRPELLVLDEATSSLDSENELAIRRALQSLRGRTTILVVAHRLSTASGADHVYVLEDGELVESGSWRELSHLPSGRLMSLIEAGSAISSSEEIRRLRVGH